jgi:hypothetical protein
MKGVVTIDPLYATAKRHKRLASRLEEHGFTCELRMRFDRLHIIAFEKDAVEGNAEETIYQLLHDDLSWHEKDCRIKILEP